jgi:molecular chaperone GrpE (heat shock protein)
MKSCGNNFFYNWRENRFLKNNMSQSKIQPADFADQMKALAEEAERQIEGRTVRKENTPPPPTTFLQMLRPLVLGLEALSRATIENTTVLSRLEAAAGNHEVLPRIVSEIEEKFQNKNEINQQLFDALHQELKGYKDGFILEVLQKPMVRDLIALYDDFAEIRRQMEVFLTDLAAARIPMRDNMTNMHVNLDHVMQFLVEIMARMEVVLMETSTGKLNKATQRAVSVELAESEAEDGIIVRNLKRGFMWRGRIVRAEEVVIKKWKEGFLIALNNETSEGNGVQLGTTDAN